MSRGPVVRIDPDLADLVAPYLATRRENLAQMREALRTGDLDSLASLAHKVHGTAGSYGFEGLSEIAARLENAALARDKVASRHSLNEFERYLATLVVSYEAA